MHDQIAAREIGVLFGRLAGDLAREGLAAIGAQRVQQVAIHQHFGLRGVRERVGHRVRGGVVGDHVAHRVGLHGAVGEFFGHAAFHGGFVLLGGQFRRAAGRLAGRRGRGIGRRGLAAGGEHQDGRAHERAGGQF
jgi:hypothetical protein